MSKELGKRGGGVGGKIGGGGYVADGAGLRCSGGKVTGSSVTCPRLTKAICCKERQRRWEGEGKEQSLGKKIVKRWRKKKVLI